MLCHRLSIHRYMLIYKFIISGCRKVGMYKVTNFLAGSFSLTRNDIITRLAVLLLEKSFHMNVYIVSFP